MGKATIVVNVVTRGPNALVSFTGDGGHFSKTFPIQDKQGRDAGTIWSTVSPRDAVGLGNVLGTALDNVLTSLRDYGEYPGSAPVGEVPLRMASELEQAWGPLVKQAASNNLYGYDQASDIEVLFDPFIAVLQVGMGGEWWTGKVSPGKNVFRHRKERGDPAYRPVTVNVRKTGHDLHFDVMGGFGSGATFRLSLGK